MAKFIQRGGKELPQVSTASLPDIVFMLLMFFMISMSMRSGEALVNIKLPDATEVAKIERKDLSSYIQIGTPMPQYQSLYGTDSRIQLNDSFKTINDIRDFIAAERETLSESDRQLMTINLKVDKETRMGIVTDVKQELRRTSALKIMYQANDAKPSNR